MRHSPAHLVMWTLHQVSTSTDVCLVPGEELRAKQALFMDSSGIDILLTSNISIMDATAKDLANGTSSLVCWLLRPLSQNQILE